ncbi:MAG: sulfite exporter TauE/SafE family protein [Verrucomicrobia bacterium]|nr:sulfite exporter TauE/SafE family protein [Verrucomicrobiota bacterium]MDA1086206.1 sulfite exporter TauE/SafE family protein [Verrucomicrobiota bacterium]
MIDPIYLAGAAVAAMVGLAKCGIPGVAILAVPLMAIVFRDARASVGILLPVLITADCFAVGYYRSHADWPKLAKIFPWVGCGILAGWGALKVADRDLFGPVLGALILALVALDLLRQRGNWTRMPHHPAFAALIGVSAGVATTVANAAGPLMILYCLCHELDKQKFMGSLAWYFLIVNLIKVPIYIVEDMITVESIQFNLAMIPAVALGAVGGRWILPRIPGVMFTRVVLILTVLAAIRLLAM